MRVRCPTQACLLLLKRTYSKPLAQIIDNHFSINFFCLRLQIRSNIKYKGPNVAVSKARRSPRLSSQPDPTNNRGCVRRRSRRGSRRQRLKATTLYTLGKGTIRNR